MTQMLAYTYIRMYNTYIFCTHIDIQIYTRSSFTDAHIISIVLSLLSSRHILVALCVWGPGTPASLQVIVCSEQKKEQTISSLF